MTMKKPILSRPHDGTRQAYRDWISEVAKFLNPDSGEASLTCHA